MNSKISFILFFGAIFSIECNNASTAPSGGPIICYNSFESRADTVGWIGIGAEMLVTDAPLGGGVQSARISGGCLIPTALTKISVQGRAKAVVIECWGKSLYGGGSVELYRASDRYAGIQIAITDTVWKQYASAARLACSPKATLELDLNSGGFVSGAMLVDQIQIRAVE
jgi:hypothetical protein